VPAPTLTGRRFSPHWFTLGFCLGYTLIFAFELPVLGYYPLTGSWSFTDLSATDGTVMHWYGLMLAAVAVGGLLGILLPDRALPGPMRGSIVAVVWVSMLACAVLLRSFFGIS
jgi:hypothetical protein